VEQNGEAKQLHGSAGYPRLSPDGGMVLFSEGEAEDLYVRDLRDGETRRLTDTPQIVERGFLWWPGRPGVVVYNYIPVEDLGPWSGYLGAVDLASGENLVLDGQNGSSWGFSLSPDGKRIAYDGGGEAMIYTWGEGSTPLSLASFGFSNPNLHLAAPAWSPDGTHLAWTILGDLRGDGNSWSGALVMDLENNTARLVHAYPILGGGGWVNTLAWSADGKWLAFNTHGEIRQEKTSLWVINLETGEEHFISNGATPVWSPQDARLAFTQWPGAGGGSGSPMDAGVSVLEAGTWELNELALPVGSQAVDWMR
jgi:Tol biopolymer transport system component